MIDAATPTGVGEGRRVLALAAGAVVFYVGLAIVSMITDWALPSMTNSDGMISTTYVIAWTFGTFMASGLAAEAAKLVAPNFNRIGLIVLMVTPIVLIAAGVFLAAGAFTFHTLLAMVCALVGTAVGLSMTFRDLMATKTTRP